MKLSSAEILERWMLGVRAHECVDGGGGVVVCGEDGTCFSSFRFDPKHTLDYMARVATYFARHSRMFDVTSQPERRKIGPGLLM